MFTSNLHDEWSPVPHLSHFCLKFLKILSESFELSGPLHPALIATLQALMKLNNKALQDEVCELALRILF
jgi:ubiquitin-protein ligase